ncbi:MAG TPA: hypothetical protein VFB19_18855 [Mycobacterium sp.]|nr:hypothetical protein [Mycobacterium sp.]
MRSYNLSGVRRLGLVLAMLAVAAMSVVTTAVGMAGLKTHDAGTSVMVVATNRDTVSTTPSAAPSGVTRAYPWSGNGWPGSNWHGGGWRG